MVNYLKNLKEKKKIVKNALYWSFHSYALIRRDPSDKFYVSRDELKGKFYDRYCDGPAYLYPIEMAHNLFNASLYTNIFKFEDVYIGMLAKRLQTKFVSLSSFYSNVKFIFSSKFKVKNKFFFYNCNLNDIKSSW